MSGVFHVGARAREALAKTVCFAPASISFHQASFVQILRHLRTSSQNRQHVPSTGILISAVDAEYAQVAKQPFPQYNTSWTSTNAPHQPVFHPCWTSTDERVRQLIQCGR